MKEYRLSFLCWAALWAWCVGCTDQTATQEEFVWAQQSGELVTCEETTKPTVIQGYETEVELVSIHGHEFNLITCARVRAGGMRACGVRPCARALAFSASCSAVRLPHT